MVMPTASVVNYSLTASGGVRGRGRGGGGEGEGEKGGGGGGKGGKGLENITCS